MSAQRKVACLLGPMFEDSEYQEPVEQFRRAGVEVDVIGREAGDTVTGKRQDVSVTIERGIDEVSPEDYDLLFIPGGHSPDQLRADPRFVEFVKRFDATGRPVAAICHGPQLLAAAHLVKGRTLTAWRTIQDDLAQMGARVRDEAVTIDGNWITSRQPDDLTAFSKAALEALDTA
jgi:protease I